MNFQVAEVENANNEKENLFDATCSKISCDSFRFGVKGRRSIFNNCNFLCKLRPYISLAIGFNEIKTRSTYFGMKMPNLK